MKNNKCLKCKHEWLPRTEDPKECPNCKNRKWAEENKVLKKEEK